MGEQRGQATVEWTTLALLVGAVLAAAVTGAAAIGAAGLPQRIVCAVLARDCRAPRPVLAGFGRGPGPPPTWRARVPVHTEAGALDVAGVVVAPGIAATAEVVGFLRRHGRTVRKVVVATAIGVGVGAACAGAVAAATAVGAATCASTVITGAYTAYNNATD